MNEIWRCDHQAVIRFIVALSQVCQLLGVFVVTNTQWTHLRPILSIAIFCPACGNHVLFPCGVYESNLWSSWFISLWFVCCIFMKFSLWNSEFMAHFFMIDWSCCATQQRISHNHSSGWGTAFHRMCYSQAHVMVAWRFSRTWVVAIISRPSWKIINCGHLFVKWAMTCFEKVCSLDSSIFRTSDLSFCSFPCSPYQQILRQTCHIPYDLSEADLITRIPEIGVILSHCPVLQKLVSWNATPQTSLSATPQLPPTIWRVAARLGLRLAIQRISQNRVGYNTSPWRKFPPLPSPSPSILFFSSSSL